MYSPMTYDYVLVADRVEDKEDAVHKKQVAFIEELKKKNMKVKVSSHQKQHTVPHNCILTEPFQRNFHWNM